MPWWTLGRKIPCHNFKSSKTDLDKYLFTAFVYLLTCQLVSMFLIQFRKYLIIGQAVAVWFSLPINFSNSLKEIFFVLMMSSSSLSHILNFFSGREIVSSLVLICQPNIVGVSDKNPSSCSLPSDRQSSRLIFLFGSSGQNRIWMAKAWLVVLC